MTSADRPQLRGRLLRLQATLATWNLLHLLHFFRFVRQAFRHIPTLAVRKELQRERRGATHRLLAMLLPCLLVACGGQSCSGCDGPLTQPTAPDQLMLPQATQLRITQHGFDVLAGNMVGLLKAVLGAGAGGQAVLDVAKLLGPQPLQFSGGFGLFQGKAGARNLILTLDLASLQIDLVDGSSPARMRISFDHAQIGVVQGIVFGETSFAGLSSDAACHLKNGLQAGSPKAHLATVSGQLDLVLGVDAGGKLAVTVQVQKPVIHDIGFALTKDCGLQECKDQVLLESACLECELCATGKLASDAAATLKDALGPILTKIMELAGNILVKQVLADTLNGKPLNVEIPLDAKALVAQAAPPLAGLLGEPAGPLKLRGRPASQAFVVQDKALQMRLDAAVFAPAHPCAMEPGLDATAVFAQLPSGPAPLLPAQMQALNSQGLSTPTAVDLALLLRRTALDEAVWSVLRSGLLCTAVDTSQLYQLSGGKLLVTVGVLDLALPGVRQLASTGAPLRISVTPRAKPQDAPWVDLAQEATTTAITLHLRGLQVAVEARVRERWLTLVELAIDADVTAGLQVIGQQLVLVVRSVEVVNLAEVGDPVAPSADWASLAPTVAKVAVQLLLAQPLKFDVDVQAAVQQVINLPIAADLVGLQAVGQGDWLLVGVSLQQQPGGKP